MIKNVEDFEVYRKAVKLFEDYIEEDLPILQKNFVGRTLAGNQLRSLDSICANMEEGYERKSGKEIKNFFRMSKGSSGESRGRFKRLKKVLPEQTINKRVAVLNEIRAMLESLIQKWV
ncbi:MAG: four helix bundle protein [Candidatus Omnitrophica bacterium]|nr:four helix bundle protein [Candidatus Omnitrophota bacterium]